MSASSEFYSYSPAHYGRLNDKRGYGWCAQSRNASQDWLKVDLGNTFEICGVATQGATVWYYVTDFKLSYSDDGNGWTSYSGTGGLEMVIFEIFSFNKQDTTRPV